MRRPINGSRSGGADLVDHALVAQDPARRAGGHIALKNMKVGAAEAGLQDADDHVARVPDFRLRPILKGLEARTAIDERLHGVLR
jgi:hypothetical protein